jgi:hypothetical protein
MSAALMSAMILFFIISVPFSLFATLSFHIYRRTQKAFITII